MNALDTFLAGCADEIEARAQLAADHGDPLREGAAAFRKALTAAAAIDRPMTTVPVAATLADAQVTGLGKLAQTADATIPWIASHRMTDGGTEAGLAPLNEVRDFDDLTVGLLLLGPDGEYPKHSHPPQELYLPICGNGQWLFGGATEYRRLGQHELVYNHPNDTHGVLAGADPLLALYVLWP